MAAVVDAYDLVIFDIDGVLVEGTRPVPGAPEALGRLRADGVPVAFATNNASRRPAEVAAMLRNRGVAADAVEVHTSARAAARRLGGELPGGAPVLVVGADGLRGEIRDAGLTVVADAAAAPAVVVQGYGPSVGWSDLAEACVAVRAGAQWVATNTDPTLPSERGPLPGNGSLVAALATALGRQPDLVVGKPAPELFLHAARAAGARRPLVVGDRLDTDIAGAVRAGMDSLLVLTGVTTAAQAAAAAPECRPTRVAADLRALWAAVGP